MAFLKVAVLGNPILRQKTPELKKSELLRESTQRFIDDMIDTMREYDGVGLAAPQVHSTHRICVIEVAGNPRYPEAPSIPLTVLVNPSLEFLTDESEVDWEGCLSVPDLRGMVPRRARIRVSALDRKGDPLEFEAAGFLARVIQHETDHLDGIVYLDRMTDLSTLTFLREFGRYWHDRAGDDEDVAVA